MGRLANIDFFLKLWSHLRRKCLNPKLFNDVALIALQILCCLVQLVVTLFDLFLLQTHIVTSAVDMITAV